MGNIKRYVINQGDNETDIKVVTERYNGSNLVGPHYRFHEMPSDEAKAPRYIVSGTSRSEPEVSGLSKDEATELIYLRALEWATRFAKKNRCDLVDLVRGKERPSRPGGAWCDTSEPSVPLR
jgi:hypothetical protein